MEDYGLIGDQQAATLIGRNEAEASPELAAG